MLFDILGTIPSEISSIFWDIDGVRTKGDNVPQEITDLTIRLDQQGVRQSFITGRDWEWLCKREIRPLKNAGLKEMPNSLWMPELGLVNIDFETEEFEINPEFQNHPLLQAQVRSRLKCLAHNENTIVAWGNGMKIPESLYLVQDANGKKLLVPKESQKPLARYIWSEYKLACGTYEVLRDENGDCLKVNPADDAKTVEKYITALGLKEDINILTVSTAVSLWPKGVDKAWSANLALEASGVPAEEIIVFGDSVSDFPMSLSGKIAFAFVGPEEQWELYEKSDIRANVVFKAKAGHKGPEVVLGILDYLKLGGEKIG